MREELNVEELFASKVFTLGKMKERLPKSTYKEVKKIMDQGGELSPATADVVATAMKDWAIENGATHYTHWFQPLTGITAEKHDAFVTHPDEDGRMIMEFSGKELIKGEPDASSFPSGGLRATFEARGYTTWDITSPAFIKETATGPTLCIPTAFCSYKGEALDKKTPLLRSMEALSKQAIRIVRLFGNTEATKVLPSVGAEQEYFLVDSAKALQREDIIFAGRTLFGAPAPKGQEMDDHYFGVIRERIGGFMHDVNIELWKLGVTSKTQHNEAAPAQHEVAPIYESANVAVDHNQLVMETLKRVAGKHGLRCMLHEKPFAGVNGSGKHNNWSITTDNGVNLLEPGQTPNENIQFLLVLACIMKAVDTHADLLRQSASNVGNDHRLGGYEAPPAIISIFLGEQLEDVVAQLVETGKADNLKEGGVLRTGVSTLPDFVKDATDRNRTSPFAFTGNKFEFRMPGSSLSLSGPNVILNTAVAESLAGFCKVLDGLTGSELDLAIHKLLKDTFTDHERIIFNGNGYTDEWLAEAEKRGLPNFKSTPEALPHFIDEKNIELFTKHHVLTKEELFSRYEILLEDYVKTLHIEAKTMEEMVQKDFLPSLFSYVNDLACTGSSKKELVPGITTKAEEKLITKLSGLADVISDELDTLKDMIGTAEGMDDYLKAGTYYHDTILAEMEKIPEIVECHFTTGPYTMLTKVYARDNEHLMDLLNNKMQEIPGVTATETLISLEQSIKKEIPICPEK